MARKQYTEAEREAAKAKQDSKRAQCDAMINDALPKLTDPAVWREFLARQSDAMGRLSLRNQLLVRMQCPGATDTAGYGDWQARGRQVCSGKDSGLLIFAPVKYNMVETPEGKDRKAEKGEEGITKMKGTKVVSTFDISQTKEIEGKAFVPSPHAKPIDPEKIREDIESMAGEHAESILAAFEEALTPEAEEEEAEGQEDGEEYEEELEAAS
jgi:hypothetical protein